MDRAGDRRGTASGLRPAPGHRCGPIRPRRRRALARESASASDGASEASEEGSVSPEDAELLAKLEAEAAADKDADKEALAAFEKIERARRRTPSMRCIAYSPRPRARWRRYTRARTR